MFEKVLASVLETYLGSFVSLDRERLKLGIWSGDLTLHNVDVRPSVLDGRGMSASMPVKLVKGVVGTLTLHCNWARLHSQAIRIALKDVYVLADMQDAAEWEQMTASKIMENIKARALRESEQLFEERRAAALRQGVAGSDFAPEGIHTPVHLSERAALPASAGLATPATRGKGKAGDGRSMFSYLVPSTLIANIVDNVEVTVENLHICVEGFLPGFVRVPKPLPTSSLLSASAPIRMCRRFTMGITLESLSMASVDEVGRAKFVESKGQFTYKRLTGSKFGVYFSTYDVDARERCPGLGNASADEEPLKSEDVRESQHAMPQPPEQGRFNDLCHSHRERMYKKKMRELEIDNDDDGVDGRAARSDGSAADGDSELSISVDEFMRRMGYVFAHRAFDFNSATSSAHPSSYAGTVAVCACSADEGTLRVNDLLRPVDFILNLRLCKRRSNSKTVSCLPRITAAVKLGAMAVQMSSDQAASISNLLLQYDEDKLRAERFIHPPAVTPCCRPSNDPRAWWRYAYRVLSYRIRKTRHSWKWSTIRTVREDMRRYLGLYSRLLRFRCFRYTNSSLAPRYFDEERVTSALKLLEQTYDVSQLRVWRRVAQIRVLRSAEFSTAALQLQRAAAKGEDSGNVNDASDEAAWGTSWFAHLLPSFISSPSRVVNSQGAGSPVIGSVASTLSGSTLWDDLNEEEQARLQEILGENDENGAEVDLLATESSKRRLARRPSSSRAGASTSIADSPPFRAGSRRGGRATSGDASVFTETFALHLSLSVETLSGKLIDTVELSGVCGHKRGVPFVGFCLSSIGVEVRQSTLCTKVVASMRGFDIRDLIASSDMFMHALVSSQGEVFAAYDEFSRDGRCSGDLPVAASELNRSDDADDEDDGAGGPLFQLRLSLYTRGGGGLPVRPLTEPDVEVWLVLRPLDVLVSPVSWTRVISFFNSVQRGTICVSSHDGSTAGTWGDLQGAAWSAISDFGSKSHEQLDLVLNNYRRFVVDVTVMAPRIVVPPTNVIARINGGFIGSVSVLVANLGCITVRGNARNNDDDVDVLGDRYPSTPMHPSVDSGSRLFDRFQISLADVSLALVPLSLLAPDLVVMGGENTKATIARVACLDTSAAADHPGRLDSNFRFALVHRLTAHADIVSSVLQSDMSLTRFRVRAHVPPVHLRISTKSFQRLHCLTLDLASEFSRLRESVDEIDNTGDGDIRSVTSSICTEYPAEERVFGELSDKEDDDLKEELERAGASSNAMAIRSKCSGDGAAATTSQRKKGKKSAETVQMECNISAPLICVSLVSDDPAADLHLQSVDGFRERNLLTLKLLRLNAEFVQRAYDSLLNLQLYGMQLEDFIQKRTHPSFRYMISSSRTLVDLESKVLPKVPWKVNNTVDPDVSLRRSDETKHLIRFTLRTMQLQSPWWDPVKPTRNKLTIDFDTLHCAYNRRTVSTLLELFTTEVQLARQDAANLSNLTEQMGRESSSASSSPGSIVSSLSDAEETVPSFSLNSSSFARDFSSKEGSASFSAQCPPTISEVSEPLKTESQQNARKNRHARRRRKREAGRWFFLSLLQRKLVPSHDGQDTLGAGSGAGLVRCSALSNPSLVVSAKLRLFTISLNEEGVGESPPCMHEREEEQGGDEQLVAGCLCRVELGGMDISASVGDNGDLHTKGELDRVTVLDTRECGLPPDSFIDDEQMWLNWKVSRSSLVTPLFWKRVPDGKPLMAFTYTMTEYPVMASKSRDMRRIEGKKGLTSFDDKLELVLSSVQCVMSTSFLLDFVKYIARTPLGQAADVAAARAIKEIERIRAEAQKRASLFSFDIRLENPLLMLPHAALLPVHEDVVEKGRHRGGTRADFLIIDLGLITLRNSFALDTVVSEVLLPISVNESQHEEVGGVVRNLPGGVYVVGPRCKMPMEELLVNVEALNVMRASALTAACSSREDIRAFKMCSLTSRRNSRVTRMRNRTLSLDREGGDVSSTSFGSRSSRSSRATSDDSSFYSCVSSDSEGDAYEANAVYAESSKVMSASMPALCVSSNGVLAGEAGGRGAAAYTVDDEKSFHLSALSKRGVNETVVMSDVIVHKKMLRDVNFTISKLDCLSKLRAGRIPNLQLTANVGTIHILFSESEVQFFVDVWLRDVEPFVYSMEQVIADLLKPKKRTGGNYAVVNDGLKSDSKTVPSTPSSEAIDVFVDGVRQNDVTAANDCASLSAVGEDDASNGGGASTAQGDHRAVLVEESKPERSEEYDADVGRDGDVKSEDLNVDLVNFHALCRVDLVIVDLFSLISVGVRGRVLEHDQSGELTASGSAPSESSSPDPMEAEEFVEPFLRIIARHIDGNMEHLDRGHGLLDAKLMSFEVLDTRPPFPSWMPSGSISNIASCVPYAYRQRGAALAFATIFGRADQSNNKRAPSAPQHRSGSVSPLAAAAEAAADNVRSGDARQFNGDEGENVSEKPFLRVRTADCDLVSMRVDVEMECPRVLVTPNFVAALLVVVPKLIGVVSDSRSTMKREDAHGHARHESKDGRSIVHQEFSANENGSKVQSFEVQTFVHITSVEFWLVNEHFSVTQPRRSDTPISVRRARAASRLVAARATAVAAARKSASDGGTSVTSSSSSDADDIPEPDASLLTPRRKPRARFSRREQSVRSDKKQREDVAAADSCSTRDGGGYVSSTANALVLRMSLAVSFFLKNTSQGIECTRSLVLKLSQLCAYLCHDVTVVNWNRLVQAPEVLIDPTDVFVRVTVDSGAKLGYPDDILSGIDVFVDGIRSVDGIDANDQSNIVDGRHGFDTKTVWVLVQLASVDLTFSFVHIASVVEICHGFAAVAALLDPKSGGSTEWNGSSEKKSGSSSSGGLWESPAGRQRDGRGKRRVSSVLCAGGHCVSDHVEHVIAKTLAAFQGHVKLQCAGMRVTLVDDAAGYITPTLRLSMPSLDVVLDSNSSGQVVASRAHGGGTRQSIPAHKRPRIGRVHVRVGIQASYYNTVLSDWEPFIEDWTLDATGSASIQRRSLTEIHAGAVTSECSDVKMFLSFASTDFLNVNLTESFLKGATLCVDSIGVQLLPSLHESADVACQARKAYVGWLHDDRSRVPRSLLKGAKLNATSVFSDSSNTNVPRRVVSFRDPVTESGYIGDTPTFIPSFTRGSSGRHRKRKGPIFRLRNELGVPIRFWAMNVEDMQPSGAHGGGGEHEESSNDDVSSDDEEDDSSDGSDDVAASVLRRHDNVRRITSPPFGSRPHIVAAGKERSIPTHRVSSDSGSVKNAPTMSQSWAGIRESSTKDHRDNRQSRRFKKTDRWTSNVPVILVQIGTAPTFDRNGRQEKGATIWTSVGAVSLSSLSSGGAMDRGRVGGRNHQRNKVPGRHYNKNIGINQDGVGFSLSSFLDGLVNVFPLPVLGKGRMGSSAKKGKRKRGHHRANYANDAASAIACRVVIRSDGTRVLVVSSTTVVENRTSVHLQFHLRESCLAIANRTEDQWQRHISAARPAHSVSDMMKSVESNGRVLFSAIVAPRGVIVLPVIGIPLSQVEISIRPAAHMERWRWSQCRPLLGSIVRNMTGVSMQAAPSGSSEKLESNILGESSFNVESPSFLICLPERRGSGPALSLSPDDDDEEGEGAANFSREEVFACRLRGTAASVRQGDVFGAAPAGRGVPGVGLAALQRCHSLVCLVLEPPLVFHNSLAVDVEYRLLTETLEDPAPTWSRIYPCPDDWSARPGGARGENGEQRSKSPSPGTVPVVGGADDVSRGIRDSKGVSSTIGRIIEGDVAHWHNVDITGLSRYILSSEREGDIDNKNIAQEVYHRQVVVRLQIRLREAQANGKEVTMHRAPKVWAASWSPPAVIFSSCPSVPVDSSISVHDKMLRPLAVCLLRKTGMPGSNGNNSGVGGAGARFPPLTTDGGTSSTDAAGGEVIDAGTIILTSQYWLVDRTGLSLQFTDREGALNGDLAAGSSTLVMGADAVYCDSMGGCAVVDDEFDEAACVREASGGKTELDGVAKRRGLEAAMPPKRIPLPCYTDTSLIPWYALAGPRVVHEFRRGMDVRVSGGMELSEARDPAAGVWTPSMRTLPIEMGTSMFSFASSPTAIGGSGVHRGASPLKNFGMRIKNRFAANFLKTSSLTAAGAQTAASTVMDFHNPSRHHRICVRLAGTGWSKPFSPDSVGTLGVIYLTELSKQEREKQSRTLNAAVVDRSREEMRENGGTKFSLGGRPLHRRVASEYVSEPGAKPRPVVSPRNAKRVRARVPGLRVGSLSLQKKAQSSSWWNPKWNIFSWLWPASVDKRLADRPEVRVWEPQGLWGGPDGLRSAVGDYGNDVVDDDGIAGVRRSPPGESGCNAADLAAYHRRQVFLERRRAARQAAALAATPARHKSTIPGKFELRGGGRSGLAKTAAAVVRREPRRLFQLGVSIALHPDPFRARAGVKVLRFCPRYIMTNCTSHALTWCQTGHPSSKRVLVPGQATPVHRANHRLRNRISICLVETGWCWAAPEYGLPLDDVGVRSVRVRNESTGEYLIFHVVTRLVDVTFEVSIVQATVSDAGDQSDGAFSVHGAAVEDMGTTPSPAFARRPEEPTKLAPAMMAAEVSRKQKNSALSGGLTTLEPAPYRIDNQSLHTLLFHQEGQTQLEQRLQPFHSHVYAWDEPCSSKPMRLVLRIVPVGGFSQSVNNAVAGGASGSMDSSRGDRSSLPCSLGSFSPDRLMTHPSVRIGRAASPGVLSSASNSLNVTVGVTVFADGRVRVICVNDVAEGGDVAPRREPVGRPLSPRSPSIMFEGTMQQRRLSARTSKSALKVKVNLAGFGVSVITGDSADSAVFLQHHQRNAAVNGSPGSRNSHRRSPLEIVEHTASKQTSANLTAAALASARMQTFVSRQRRELMYATVSGVYLHFRDVAGMSQLRFSVRGIQLDNQLRDAHFPVVLCPLLPRVRFGGKRSEQAKQHPPGVGDVGQRRMFDARSLYGAPSPPSRRMPRKSVSSMEQQVVAVGPAFVSLSLSVSRVRSNQDFVFLPRFQLHIGKVQLRVEEVFIDAILRCVSDLGPTLNRLSVAATSLSSRRAGASGLAVEEGSVPGSRGRTPGDGGALPFTPSRLTPSKAGVQNRRWSPLEEETQRRNQRLGVRGHHRVRSIARRLLVSEFEAGSSPTAAASSKKTTHRRSRSAAGVSSSVAAFGIGQRKKMMTALTVLRRKFILYFQSFSLSDIHVSVTYSSAADGRNGGLMSRGGVKPLGSSWLLRAIGVTLLNIDDAPLALSALHLTQVFASGTELRDQVLSHYGFQAIREMYKLLGYSDILGNPVGLFTSISVGVRDFLYEPAQGLTRSPQAFGSGIARGTASLLQNSLYGISNAFTRVLTSVSKGLASLSASALALNSADHAAYEAGTAEGLLVEDRGDDEQLTIAAAAHGMTVAEVRHMRMRHRFERLLLVSLFDGVWKGVSGLVVHPFVGLQHGGWNGLVRGTVKGTVAFFLLPLAGLINFLNSGASAMRAAVDPMHRPTRVREPRLFDCTGVLRPFARWPLPLLQFLSRYLARNMFQRLLIYEFAWPLEDRSGGGDATSSNVAAASGYSRLLIVFTTTRLVIVEVPNVLFAERKMELRVRHELPLVSISRLTKRRNLLSIYVRGGGAGSGTVSAASVNSSHLQLPFLRLQLARPLPPEVFALLCERVAQ